MRRKEELQRCAAASYRPGRPLSEKEKIRERENVREKGNRARGGTIERNVSKESCPRMPSNECCPDMVSSPAALLSCDPTKTCGEKRAAPRLCWGAARCRKSGGSGGRAGHALAMTRGRVTHPKARSPLPNSRSTSASASAGSPHDTFQCPPFSFSCLNVLY